MKKPWKLTWRWGYPDPQERWSCLCCCSFSTHLDQSRCADCARASPRHCGPWHLTLCSTLWFLAFHSGRWALGSLRILKEFVRLYILPSYDPMIFLSYDPPYLNPSLPDEKLGVFAVLGLVGVAADWLSLAVFSLIVAESTVFCRLKFEFVLVWLLLVEVRGTAVGGPGGKIDSWRRPKNLTHGSAARIIKY